MISHGQPLIVSLDRPHRRHLIAASLAVVVSVLFHVLIIPAIPPIPVGNPPNIKKLMDGRKVPIVVKLPIEVEQKNSVLDDPIRFEPRSPERVAAMEKEIENFTDALKDAIPDTIPFDQKPELVGNNTVVEEAPEARIRADWSARQDIIQINETLFSESESMLPRRYVADTARNAEAPDIALPSDDLAMLDLKKNLSFDVIGPPSSLFGPGTEPALDAPILGKKAPVEIDKTNDEVSDLLKDEVENKPEPIDEHLELDIHTFKDSAGDDKYIYFKLDIKRHGDAELAVIPKDVLLMQDSSYSMTQSKLDLCKEGLLTWMRQLNPQDRFNIISFRDEVQWCFDDWRRLNPVVKTLGIDFIERMRAKGKTDVYASLKALASLKMDATRPVIAVLVTDGRPTMGMVDSSDIIHTFSDSNQGNVSVFAMGGGKRVNGFLLDMLSYTNRGDSSIVREKEEIPKALERWSVRLRRPVLTSLTYRFSGLKEQDIYPKTLMHLYLDRPLEIYGRLENIGQNVAFQVVGKSGGKEFDMLFEMDLGEAEPGDSEIRTKWANHKVHHLIGRHIQKGDPRILRELNQLSEDYRIHVPYTSDIAPRF